MREEQKAEKTACIYMQSVSGNKQFAEYIINKKGELS